MLSLVSEILKAAIPAIIEAIKVAMDDGKTAEELRNKPLSISVAFGGGEGDSGKVLVTIEEKLP